MNTLSNIFTMRLIGNKTHGDLAEIGMVAFINQFMYGKYICEVRYGGASAQGHKVANDILRQDIDRLKEL